MSLGQTMKKAMEMAKNLERATKQLDATVHPFSYHNDMIKGEMNGNNELLSLEIDSSLLEDKEMLQDLLIVSLNEQIKLVNKKRAEALAKVTGKSKIPGLF